MPDSKLYSECKHLLQQALQSMTHSTSEHKAYLFVVLTYGIICTVREKMTHDPYFYVTALFANDTFMIAYTHMIFIIILSIMWCIIRTGPQPQRPLQAIQRMIRPYLRPHSVNGMLIVLCSLPLFSTSFISGKRILAFYSHYRWDTWLYNLDYRIFLNHDPWTLLHHLFGSSFFSYFMNEVYLSWFIIQTSFFVYMSLQKRRFLRMQYLVSYLLTWILLGDVLAYIFASVGPCFYLQQYGTAHAPHSIHVMHAYFTQHPVDITILQQSLWDNYLSKSHGFVGISAFPSLHVGITVLITLTLYDIHTWLGRVASIYTGLTIMSTIYLGWHYFVDDAAASLGAAAIWYSTGYFMKKYGYFANPQSSVASHIRPDNAI